MLGWWDFLKWLTDCSFLQFHLYFGIFSKMKRKTIFYTWLRLFCSFVLNHDLPVFFILFFNYCFCFCSSFFLLIFFGRFMNDLIISDDNYFLCFCCSIHETKLMLFNFFFFASLLCSHFTLEQFLKWISWNIATWICLVLNIDIFFLEKNSWGKTIFVADQREFKWTFQKKEKSNGCKAAIRS